MDWHCWNYLLGQFNIIIRSRFSLNFILWEGNFDDGFYLSCHSMRFDLFRIFLIKKIIVRFISNEILMINFLIVLLFFRKILNVRFVDPLKFEILFRRWCDVTIITEISDLSIEISMSNNQLFILKMRFSCQLCPWVWLRSELHIKSFLIVRQLSYETCFNF